MNIKPIDKKYTAIIHIKNLTIAQSLALEDMMCTWETLGNVGASRWTSFFADGDGNFHPKILFNGSSPRKTDLLNEDQTWGGSEYKIDFDVIAWKLRDNEPMEKKEAKRFGFLRILLYTVINGIRSIIRQISFEIKLERRFRQGSEGRSTATSTKNFNNSEEING